MREFNLDIYDPSCIKPCEAGSPEAIDFQLDFDENGEAHLVGEKYDLQAIIQSHKDECSIERILIAHGLGDDSVLQVKPGVFLDESQVNVIKESVNLNSTLETQLISLYEPYKDKMSYGEFAQAVVHGDFDKLVIKKDDNPNGGNE